MTRYSIRNPDTGRFESFSSWEAFVAVQPSCAPSSASRADIAAKTYAGMAGAVMGFLLGLLLIPPLLEAVGLVSALSAGVCAVLMLFGSIGLAALVSCGCSRFAEMAYASLAPFLLLASLATSGTLVVAFGWWALS